jgi:hypothetical protein
MNKKTKNLNSVISSTIKVILVALMFQPALLSAKEVKSVQTQSNPSITDLKVDYLQNKLYFRWLAKDVKHDGLFMLQQITSTGVKTISYKAAIGVLVTFPLLYCLTMGDSINLNSSYRIKYLGVKGDSAISPVVAPMATEQVAKQPVEYLKVKITKDTLFDEAAILIGDSTKKASTQVIKKFFEGEHHPFLFFRSNESNPLCLRSVDPTAEKNIVPVYFKHSSGGFYTLSFKKQIKSQDVKVYIENIKTKELTEINHNDSMELYLTGTNDGKTPCFNVVIVNNSETGDHSIEQLHAPRSYNFASAY